jgi:Protein of unknown function (DUF3108)
MKKILVLNIYLVWALILNMACFNTAWGETPDLPFRSGEKMTFQVRWSFILAGEATIELLPVTNISEKDAHHFLFTAKTSEFVDIFYKVRDRIESYTDISMHHSLFYYRSHEGKSVKDTTVEFDWDKNQAQYSRIGESKKTDPLPIPEGTFDPLSVFFVFRIPVTDGKQVVLGKVNVIKEEKVIVNGTSYDTFLVEPELGNIGGVFEKSKDAKLQIWVTSDDRRIPVRIKSKVIVGNFVADLTSYRDGTDSDQVSRKTPEKPE